MATNNSINQPTGTITGTILRWNGTFWVPTTATYPNVTTINQLLYSSAANVISGIPTNNNGIYRTNASGVPSLMTTALPLTLGGTAATTAATARSSLAVPEMLLDSASSPATPNGVENPSNIGDLCINQFGNLGEPYGRFLYCATTTSGAITTLWRRLSNIVADLCYLGVLAGTYNNGAGSGANTGQGATLTDNSGTFAALVVDGITPTVGQVVFLPLNGVSGGVYRVTQQGDTISLPWILTRYYDYDNNSKLVPGTMIIIASGNTQAGKRYSLLTQSSSLSIGTTSLSFTLPETINFDSSGNELTYKGNADLSKLIVVPTTGGTVTLSTINRITILNPATTLATLTINMPASPVDGQKQRVTTTQAITALTVSGNGNSIVGVLTTLAIGGAFSMIFDLASTTWYPG